MGEKGAEKKIGVVRLRVESYGSGGVVGSGRNGLDAESHCFGDCASRRILLRRNPELGVVSQLAEAVRI